MDERKCQNCKYFILYYINTRGLYTPMPFGHCICEEVKANRKKRIFCNNVCEYWESNETKIQECYKRVENAIVQMSEDLRQYMQFINEQKDN